MSESLILITTIVGALASILATILSYVRIYRKSGNQSPTTWRLNHSKDFKDLKAKYFQEKHAGAESESYH